MPCVRPLTCSRLRAQSPACPRRAARRAHAPLSAAMPLLLEPARARGRRWRADTATGRLCSPGGPSRRAAAAPLGRRAHRTARPGGDRRRRGGGGPLYQPDHAGVLLTRARLEALAAARPRPRAALHPGRGARHADRIAHYRGGTPRSAQLARLGALGLPLTINAPVHRQNLDRLAEIIDFAAGVGAGRLEVAHVQYYGWALANRAALMPTREQLKRSAAIVEAARERLEGFWSSTSWCRTTTPPGRSPAWAAGAAASSTSRPPARCCPATPPRPFRVSPSTTCATQPLRRHLAASARPSRSSAVPTG